jgi:Bestrophin, RFP-TM, chloride channel
MSLLRSTHQAYSVATMYFSFPKVTKMVYASIVFIICRSVPQIKPALSGFNILWAQLLSVTTFTLTFFVNQSYALWRKCSELSRSLQGRLHDLDLALATHAARNPSTRDEPSTYTAPAKQILEVVARYVRLFNLLTYASFTRSHRPILTPAGMRRLVDRGLMTSLEREVLVAAEIPATQRHNAVLMWIIRTFIEGKEAGHFIGHAGFEQQFMEKAHVCRSAYGGIGDELQGRMPLAYVHIVQVLVDLVRTHPCIGTATTMLILYCLTSGAMDVPAHGLFVRNVRAAVCDWNRTAHSGISRIG